MGRISFKRRLDFLFWPLGFIQIIILWVFVSKFPLKDDAQTQVSAFLTMNLKDWPSWKCITFYLGHYLLFELNSKGSFPHNEPWMYFDVMLA